jgi:hypothetical protein
MPANANMFQFRRIYLGYNYEISKRFSAEFLLAAEDNFNNGLDQQSKTPATAGSAGDILANGKFAPYVKLANVRWKNIWHGSDLVFGMQNTPAFAKQGRNDQTAEEVWGYRSIERTITDIRRTPSFDMGASLQGWFDNKGNFGYVAMVGNSTSAKPETDNYKSLYGDLFAKFFNKRLVVDLYQDYTKSVWGQYVPVSSTNAHLGNNGPLYRDRNMTKLFVAWQTKMLTVGVEVFHNTLMGDAIVGGKDGQTYYRTTNAMGYSLFVKGRIYKDQLGFFARYDGYDPSGNLSNVAADKNVKTISFATSQYDATTKEQFVTFGFDYTPIKNVHIMPNVWLNTYNSALSNTGSNAAGTKYSTMNSNIVGSAGTDAVYRLTLYYIYGK